MNFNRQLDFEPIVIHRPSKGAFMHNAGYIIIEIFF